jgi:hypothetical protein
MMRKSVLSGMAAMCATVVGFETKAAELSPLPGRASLEESVTFEALVEVPK